MMTGLHGAGAQLNLKHEVYTECNLAFKLVLIEFKLVYFDKNYIK